VLAEFPVAKPVSARGGLLTDSRVLVICPYQSLSLPPVSHQSLLSTFELTAVLISKDTKNRTKLNVRGLILASTWPQSYNKIKLNL